MRFFKILGAVLVALLVASGSASAMIVINEILYDGAVDGDPNGDGTTDPMEDEFVELVNDSDEAVDISGWMLADDAMVRHVFPMGTVIAPHCAIVVFGGGEPDDSLGFEVQVASESSLFGLALDDDFDTVNLYMPTGVYGFVDYTGTGNGVSLVRSPEITGWIPLVDHDTVPGAMSDFSPGFLATGNPFPGCAPFTWYRDADGDGYGDPGDSSTSYTQPDGYIVDGTDCDDTNDTVHPGAAEICGDGLANDCEGAADEGCSVLAITAVHDVGNDQGRRVRVRWDADAADNPVIAEPTVSYSLYRRIDAHKATDTSDWDFVANVPAVAQLAYSTLAETLCDSTADGVCWSVFAVRAHRAVPSVFTDSAPDSGYSVDNLAPDVPLGLMVAYTAGGNDLQWLESGDADFRYHKVYRGTSSDFVVDPQNPAHVTAAAAWTDAMGGYDAHYKVSAVDFAGNESPAAAPQEISGTDAPAFRFALHGNVPNPFNPRTTILFNLPAHTEVTLRVYDVAGRVVATLLDRVPCGPGRHETVWEGRDAAGRRSPAGTYFYRLEAGDRVGTARMVLVK